MEKVRLTLDALHVQSFATSSESPRGRGTVHAHDAPTDAVECPTGNAADWDNTCANTCMGTCQCEGNTGDCTIICYTDGDWTRGSWYISYC